MNLTPEQHAAASKAIRDRLGSSAEWAHLAEAVRIGTEHVEAVVNGDDFSGQDKRAAAVTAIRAVVSTRLRMLLRSWRGPFYVGWWAYPVLALFVYPFVYLLGMWAFDRLAPRFVDMLVDASKGKLKLNLERH